MDASLTDLEKRMYSAWLHSPSVHSVDPLETILAFKISKQIQLPGSKVLKALRGQPGLPEALVRAVEHFVDGDPTLTFVYDGDARRITLAP